MTEDLLLEEEPLVSVLQGEPPKPVLFAAVGLVVIYDQRLLLLKRARDRTHARHWGLPGGKIEPRETALDAIIRETFEETGILREPDNLSHVGDFLVEQRGTSFKYVVFLTHFDTLPNIRIDAQEHERAEWFTFAEAFQLDLVPGNVECLRTVEGKVDFVSQAPLFAISDVELHAGGITKSDRTVRDSIPAPQPPDSDPVHVVIVGPPGSGKTTLLRNLETELPKKWKAIPSVFARNRSSRQYNYLTKYHAGNNSFAFICQVEAFLGRYWRTRTMSGQYNLSDEWIFNTLAYSRVLRAQGDLNEDEYQTLYLLYLTLQHSLPTPSLVISLTAIPSELRKRVLLRDRKLDRYALTEGYLTNLKVSFDALNDELSDLNRVLRIDTTDKRPDEVLKDTAQAIRELENTISDALDD